jgi:hypothetical protein
MALIISCPECGTRVFPQQDGKCPQCRAVIAEPSPVPEPRRPPGDDAQAGSQHSVKKLRSMPSELHNYVFMGTGISRTALNVLCLVGIVIFGWLLLGVFETMGRKETGWVYLAPLVGIVLLQTMGVQAQTGVLFLTIYAVGWIHANLALSQIRALGRKRIVDIDALPPEERGVDALIEKAVIQHKALRDAEQCVSGLTAAMSEPGGTPRHLNQAGVMMFRLKRYDVAEEFFGRASSGADARLSRVIQQNLARVKKRLVKGK